MFIEVHVKGGVAMMLNVNNIDFIAPAVNSGGSNITAIGGEEILVTEAYDHIRCVLHQASLLST